VTATFIAHKGNCLRACVATILQADRIEQVPDPWDHFEPGHLGGRGFDINGWNDELERQTGYGVRMVSFSECPPGGRLNTRDWIAIMHTSVSEHETHAVLCRGATLLYDPGNVFRAYQPSAVEYGLELVEV